MAGQYARYGSDCPSKPNQPTAPAASHPLTVTAQLTRSSPNSRRPSGKRRRDRARRQEAGHRSQAEASLRAGPGRRAAGRVAGAGAQQIPHMASLLRLTSPLPPSKPLLRPRLPPARPSASESRGQARYESVKVGHCFISC